MSSNGEAGGGTRRDGNADTRGDESTVAALAAQLAAILGDTGTRVANDIIAALLDVPRFWPAANPEDVVADDVARAARRAATRLHDGAPFAYSVGRACFRHLTLEVDERVLIPRPETELIVDEILRTHATGGLAADVGTGSGAIALALASEAKLARVVATDVSTDALSVARRNAAMLAGALTTPLEFRQGSLLQPLRGESFSVIVSNPPYIAYHEAFDLPAGVRDWEPALALFSGEDGMTATAALIRGAAELLESGGLLALEVDARRAGVAAEMLAVDMRYRDVAVRLDLAGRERFVLALRA